MTAYHCVSEADGGPDHPRRFTVFLGDSDISQINLQPKLQEYGKKKVTHIDGFYKLEKLRTTDYNEIVIKHDTAILTLDNAVDFTFSIRPIFVLLRINIY